MTKDIPTLPAWPSPDGKQWKVWCPHCRRYHFHGPPAGHRVAHCTRPDSPFRGTGYFIELADGPPPPRGGRGTRKEHWHE
jgi:hypothetical protein